MREYSAAERASLAASKLAAGQHLTARELARQTGCSERSALRTLALLSIYFPLRTHGGRWALQTSYENVKD